MIEEYSLDKIGNNIDNWVKTYLGSSFSFREHQRDTIIDIIDNVINPSEQEEHKNKCHIIEAPTGSGKSLISIISAGVLNTYYGKRSYILASDLYLWQQYYDFINGNKRLSNIFGCLKGQTGNYVCQKNGEDLRNCECRMAGISWGQLYNGDTADTLGFNCARTCKYLRERKKALRSPVTLLTYALFFYVVDILNDDERIPIFDHRDVLFCDEAHNIPNLVQMQYSPCIKPTDTEHLYTIYNFGLENSLSIFKDEFDVLDKNILDKYPNIDVLKADWERIWNTTKDYHTDIDTDYKNVMEIHKYWNQFQETVENIESIIVNKLKNRIPLSNTEYKIYRECTFFENYLTSFRDYSKTISIVGKKYIVKNICEKDKEVTNVNFHCAREDYMVFQYLLLKTPNKVLLSATIGDKESYEDNIGIKYYGMNIEGVGSMYDLAYNYIIADEVLHDLSNAKVVSVQESVYQRIPSTFDFSKSPIYFLNRYKMGFNERSESLRHLKPIIYKICLDKFKDKRGIIQTGSYQIAKEIIDDAPIELKKRLLYYNGSKEKTTNIIMHQMSKDTILIGPTLNEGIDLPGDQCRFIIIMKVPYPQIKDRLVNAKMKLFPLWYNSVASTSIIQGIGRGNRFKDDWCVTYIVDACFYSLYLSTQNQYPKELQERLKIYN